MAVIVANEASLENQKKKKKKGSPGYDTDKDIPSDYCGWATRNQQ